MDDLITRVTAEHGAVSESYEACDPDHPQYPHLEQRKEQLEDTLALLGLFSNGDIPNGRLSLVVDGIMTVVYGGTNNPSDPIIVQNLTHNDWIVNERLIARRMPALPMGALISLNQKFARDFPEIGPDDTCDICYEALLPDTRVIKLECNHYFEARCILKWFVDHVTCPMCRANVEENTVRRNLFPALSFPFNTENW